MTNEADEVIDDRAELLDGFRLAAVLRSVTIEHARNSNARAFTSLMRYFPQASRSNPSR